MKRPDTNDDYYEKLRKLSILEEEALASYSSVTGDNYKDVAIMNNTLSTMVIPKYQAYSEQLKNISPNTMEVKHVHQLLSEGTNLKIKALKLFQNAIAQNDEMLMNDGNKIMKMGKQKIQEAKMEADILIRR